MRDPFPDKPKPVNEVVESAMKAMEASLKNPITAEAKKRQEAERRVEDRFDRYMRMKESDLINAISSDVAERVAVDDLEETRSLKIVKDWYEVKNPFLFLTGPTGVGKTVAGAWVIANHGGLYVRAQQLERAGLAVFGPYEELLQRVYRERVLFIDDLGTEFRLSEFSSVLSEIINNRQGGGLRTVFTSNLVRSEIEEKYFGRRELSRLKNVACYITDDAEDMRERDVDC
jgi:DNA replication protein DnaC